MRRRRRFWPIAIAGLFAAGLPAAASRFTSYHCSDGSEFVVGFYEGHKQAFIQLDGKAITLSKRVSVRGARYVKGDITLRIAKTGVTLKRGRRTTDCSAD